MLIKDIMTEDFIKLSPYNTLRDAAIAFKNKDNFDTIVIVNEQGKPVSMITRKDFFDIIVGSEDLNTCLADVVRTKITKVSIEQEITNELKKDLYKIVVVDKEGQPVGVISREKLNRLDSIFQDTTCQEPFLNKIEEMRNLINYLDAVIDSSYDGIYITDKNGLTLRVNSAYERITGVKREELIGRYVEDLVKKGILSESITKRVVKSKQPITILQRIKTGKQVVITGSPIFDEKGEVKEVVTNVRDVTELKKLYEQLERSKALTQKYKLDIQNLKGQQNIVASSKKMRHIMEKVNIISRVDSTVLLTGESGVGKEVIATAIHESSPRNKGPFIKINCSAIPENLLESELFGYEPGAFTGARKSKPGMFELAHEGSLFLDEITEMPYKLQVKLLRVLQEQEIVRLGGIKSIKIDVRIIAATNKDIRKMVSEGRFREDLYYRLNVVPMHIPPLRERKDDIPVLANYFLEMFNKRYGMNKTFDKHVIEVLTDYHWPGNVRELKNIIERLVVSSLDKNITVDDIPEGILKKHENEGYSISVNKILPLKEAVEELECQLVNKAWEQYKTTYEMAKALQISQPTASRKMRKYLSIHR
ncbi:MAG: hypothetical protein PWQ82_1524 [Thermosediminibacterales bacterium]|nr:hypothetical protein [Thermosediminibacterales bacterium]